jgi:hypothetical protein
MKPSQDTEKSHWNSRTPLSDGEDGERITIGALCVAFMRRAEMRKFAFILLQLFLPFTAFATTYYVTQSGAGSQNGSNAANAWSLSTFNSTKTPAAGDKVTFSGTFTSNIAPACNGSSSAPLVLDFASQSAVIQTGGVSLVNNSYLTINGGSFSTNNTGTAADGALIDFPSGQSHNVIVNGWKFTGTPIGVVDFVQTFSGGCYNLTVQNNTIVNMTHFWLSTTTNTHDVLLLNNFAQSNTNAGLSQPVTQTDIINVGDAYNVTIQGNVLWNQTPGNQNLPANNMAHNDIIQTFQSGAAANGEPTNWIIRYNWVANTAVGGDGSTSWTMMENMGGSPACQIYSNVFVCLALQSSNGVTFDSNDPAATFYFYNNTCVANPGPSNIVRFLSPGILYAENNLIASALGYNGTAASWTMTAGATWNYNFFSTAGTITSNAPGPNGSVTVNPGFANFSGGTYSLVSTSALINGGDSKIGAPYNQGIAPGATWPNPTLAPRSVSAWGVGAYQSNTSPPAPQGLRISAN